MSVFLFIGNMGQAIFFVIPILITIITCEECGQLNSDNNSVFPWNVGIYVGNNNNNNKIELICFATVIKPNAIITAAHCLCDRNGKLRNDSFYIVFGQLEKHIEIGHHSATIHKLDRGKILLNPNFLGLSRSASDDVALIHLDRKLSFDNTIQPICVDWTNFKKFKTKVGKQAAWNNKMEIIEKSIEDYSDCYSDVPEAFLQFLTSDKICTKSINVPTKRTREDEGAGLVLYDREANSWYLYGIKCADDETNGEFSVYTKISQHMNWLSNRIVGL